MKITPVSYTSFVDINAEIASTSLLIPSYLLWNLIYSTSFPIFYVLRNFMHSFAKGGGIHRYLCVISYCESIYRKGFVTVDGGIFLPTHFKWNGKLYWMELIIVKLWPLLLCNMPVSTFLYTLLPIWVVSFYLMSTSCTGQRRVTTSRVPNPLNFGWFLCKTSLGLLFLSYYTPLWLHAVKCWTFLHHELKSQGMLSCISCQKNVPF